jgi:hypothetical protein
MKGDCMKRFKGKENINTLLNIDSVFGEYEGRVLPIVLTLACAALPLLIWLFLLQGTPIKFWWVCIFDLLFTGRMALIILGKEKVKMQFYEQQRNDEYKSADELIHVNHVHENGLIEFDNGRVGLLISGYLREYLTEDKLSVDMENFMNELDNGGWQWDMMLHNTVDELLCEDTLPNLKRYKDNEVIQERIGFYAYQDEWSREHTGLYRVTFLVTSAKYAWKKLIAHMGELTSSEIALLFNEIKVCDYDDVIELFNRDICGFADLKNMLIKKYDNDEYYASKVLWYDDNVPKELVPAEETSSLEERRQS